MVDAQEVAANALGAAYDAADFISHVRDLPVTIIVSCVASILPVKAYARRVTGFKLTKEDVKPIVDKWVEHGRLDDKVASDVLSDATLRRRYGNQLFAFLCLLFSKSLLRKDKHDYLRKFEDDYKQIRNPTKNVYPIASCQLIGVPVPLRLVQELDADFTLDHSFFVIEPFQGNKDDEVYEAGGIFLPKWLLEQKLGKKQYQDLLSCFDDLARAAEALKDFGITFQSERQFFPQLFSRLAEGLPPALFQGRSQVVAHTFLCNHESYFKGVINDVEQTGELVDQISWGEALLTVNRWDLALPLFWAAFRSYRTNSDNNLRDAFRLIYVVSDAPDRELVQAVAALLPSLMEKIIADPELRATLGPKCLHVYTDYLRKLGKISEAIDVWRKYVKPEGVIEADSLLHVRLGELEEARGENIESAISPFRESVRLAATESPKNEVSALHRFATFLSRNVTSFAPESTNELFARTRRCAEAAGVTWEPAVVSWAQYKCRLADRANVLADKKSFTREAEGLLREAVKSYRDREIIEPHAWQVLASLLVERGIYLEGDHTEWLAEAEKLCREVAFDELTHWRSKLMANHVLGRLIGLTDTSYSFESRARPNMAEALNFLRQSFESPAAQRSTEAKTYQDAIAHRAIKDLYEKAVKNRTEGRPERAARDTRAMAWLRREEHHARYAFEYLAEPYLPEPGWRLKEHVLLARDWFCFFLWNVKLKADAHDWNEIITEANENYQRNVEDLERWRWGAGSSDGRKSAWGEAFKLYIHYLYFISRFRREFKFGEQRELHEKIKHLMKGLIGSIPSANVRELLDHTRNGERIRSLCSRFEEEGKNHNDTELLNLSRELRTVWSDLGYP